MNQKLNKKLDSKEKKEDKKKVKEEKKERKVIEKAYKKGEISVDAFFNHGDDQKASLSGESKSLSSHPHDWMPIHTCIQDTIVAIKQPWAL